LNANMGMDLNGEGGSFRFSQGTWRAVLELAREHGWEPAGTKPPEFKAHGIRGFLSPGRVFPQSYVWSDPPTNTAMAVHIVTPAPDYLNKGKSRIQMETHREGQEVA
jgi:hypothetical protein